MIGTNHTVESGFMDNLPFSLRDAAIDLLKFYRLKELILMYQTEPPLRVRNEFNLTSNQWQQTLRAVILTKVSYFTISPNFPNPYINKLLEIAAYALQTPDATLTEMYHQMEREYPYFARWLLNIHQVKLIKYKKLQAKKNAATTP